MNDLSKEVNEKIIEIAVEMKLRNDFSQEDIYWEIAQILEDHDIQMQAEQAYNIAFMSN